MLSTIKNSKKSNSKFEINQNEECSQNDKFDFMSKDSFSKILNKSNKSFNFIKSQIQPTSKENICDSKFNNEFSDSDIPPDLSSQTSEKVFKFATWGVDSQVTSQEMFGSDYIYLRSSQTSSQKNSQNLKQNVFLGNSQSSQLFELSQFSQKSISSSQKSNYFECGDDKLKLFDTPVNSQEEKSVLVSNNENVHSKKGKGFGQLEPEINLNNQSGISNSNNKTVKNNFNNGKKESTFGNICSNEVEEQDLNTNFYFFSNEKEKINFSDNYNKINSFTNVKSLKNSKESLIKENLYSFENIKIEPSNSKKKLSDQFIYDSIIENSNTSIHSDHRPYTPSSLIEDLFDENSNDTVCSLKRKNSATHSSMKIVRITKNDMKKNSISNDCMKNLSAEFQKTSIKTPNKKVCDFFSENEIKSTRSRNDSSNHFFDIEAKFSSTSESTNQKKLEVKSQMNRLSSLKKNKDSKKLNQLSKNREPKLLRKIKLNFNESPQKFTRLDDIKVNNTKNNDTSISNSSVDSKEKFDPKEIRRVKNNDAAKKYRQKMKNKYEELEKKKTDFEKEELDLKKKLIDILIQKKNFLSLVNIQI